MKAGDVCLARFPFGGSAGSKVRPVLVLTGPLGPVPEVLVAYMSSVIPPTTLATDIVIDPLLAEFATTGLKATSIIRLHKLATVHARDVARRLGEVSPATLADVNAKLRAMLNL